MVQEIEVIEIDIDGRTQKVRPVGSWVLQSNNVVAERLAVSLDEPLEWAVGFFFGNVELSLELWTVTSGISGLDDWVVTHVQHVSRGRRVGVIYM